MSERTPTDQPRAMKHHESHLKPDGTTFPPVTPDPPPPPGYVDPLAEFEGAEPPQGGGRTAHERTGGGDPEGEA